MARGYADFGLNPSNYGQFSGDNAELAARLNATVVFERRGRVLWFDDMSMGLAKYNLNIPVGASLNPVALNGFHNGVAFRFTPGLDGLAYPTMGSSLPMFTVSKFGFECLIRFLGVSDASATDFVFQYYYLDGANQYLFAVRISPNNRYIKIISGLPGLVGAYYPIITPYPMWGNASDVSYNYFKIVFDLSTGYFTRIVFNQLGADLSVYHSTILPNLSKPKVDISWICQPNAAGNFVDICDPIVTVDEP